MNIALIVKATPSTQEREQRNMGYWSYPVEGFTWHHFPLAGSHADGKEMNDYDLVVQEDAGPIYLKGLKRPLVFVDIDSTISGGHLEMRLKRAAKARLILVEQNKLDVFASLDKPVKRFNYCVNDHLFKDYKLKRTIDVSFHCASGGLLSRQRTRIMLSEFCEQQGLNYTSGVLNIVDYARAMAQSKIVVNWPRVYGNRPHRIFDAMACGACVVTGPLPDIDGDERIEGQDYVEVRKIGDLVPAIQELLRTERWREIAENGKRLVGRYHTWAIRAKQFKRMLNEENVI